MSIDPAISEALEVGLRHERTLGSKERKAGAHFTPAEVAGTIVDDALDVWGTGTPLICDPACGGGVFLVLAAEALWRRGLEPSVVLRDGLLGYDLSASAVAASRAALERWALARDAGDLPDDVVGIRDALDGTPWVGRDGRRPDIVVGNPPFRSQLARRTVRGEEERRRLVETFGPVAKGYVDLAAIFAVAAVRAVNEDGVVTLVLPRSIVAARDAAAARDDISGRAAMWSFWGPGQRLFDAAVDVVVPTFAVGRSRRADGVVVRGGRDRRVVGRVPPSDLELAGTWSPAWATSEGLPELNLDVEEGRRRVGDVAATTAGFRDHYYGVVDHLSAHAVGDDARRLVTTAMIDPGVARWGERDVVVARRTWRTPWVDVAAVAESSPRLDAWCTAQSRPKVLVATQTRIIEAVADRRGEYVPLTPIITIHPTSPDSGGAHSSTCGVDELAAAVSAPSAALWALRMFGGGGMSRSALKMSAAQVGRLPLPVDGDAWARATDHFADAAVRGPYAAVAIRSWGLDRPDIADWWMDRVRGR